MAADLDKYFKQYGTILFKKDAGGCLVAWPWFKAQGIAESALDPHALSSAGAQGIMQIMPRTQAQVAKWLQIAPDPYDARTSILMGIRYDLYLWEIFKKEYGLERVRFMLGAYNAGAGSIIKAQRLTNRPDNWEAVSSQLPKITGAKNAQQTTDYVRKIEKIRLSIIED